MGRGRADPLPPLECRLASPPSPPSFSVASLAHFLSPTDPTEHAHTHAHTHFGGPGALLPAGRFRPPELGERRPFVIQITLAARRAADSDPGIGPLVSPPLPGSPQLIQGFPSPRGLAAPVRPRGRASPAPVARCGSALGPLPLSASLPPPLPFSGPASVLPLPPPLFPVRGGPAGRPPRSMAPLGLD